MEYIRALKDAGRDNEIPRYVIVSDFNWIYLHDLDEGKSIEFALEDLYKHVHEFAFIPGYKQHTFADQDPVNIRAVELLGDLHDVLEDGGYSGHGVMSSAGGSRLLVDLVMARSTAPEGGLRADPDGRSPFRLDRPFAQRERDVL